MILVHIFLINSVFSPFLLFSARESRHTSTQRRSSSLSYSANSGMSKSMVLFETADGAVLPLSGTALSIIENGNRNSGSSSVLNGKQSPRFRRTQMAAVEIDFGGSVPSTPARIKNGKNSIGVLFNIVILSFF